MSELRRQFSVTCYQESIRGMVDVISLIKMFLARRDQCKLLHMCLICLGCSYLFLEVDANESSSRWERCSCYSGWAKLQNMRDMRYNMSTGIFTVGFKSIKDGKLKFQWPSSLAFRASFDLLLSCWCKELQWRSWGVIVNWSHKLYTYE